MFVLHMGRVVTSLNDINSNQIQQEMEKSTTQVSQNVDTLMGQAPTGTKNSTNILVPQSTHVLKNPEDVISANQFPLPPSHTVLVTSLSGGGAADTVVYLFNQDRLNNITNNGSGAGSIEYVYQDGFGGNVVSDYLGLSRAGVGAICYGVSIRANDATTGAGLPSGLAVTNPAFLVYNCYGFNQPTNFNVTADQTRGDYDTSIEVMPCVCNVPFFSQFSFLTQPNVAYTVTFYFTNLFKR